MVRITNRRSARNGMGSIRTHLEYINRNGRIALEEGYGDMVSGQHEVRELAQMWRFAGWGIPEKSTRREVFNVMLSMPPGTKRDIVKDAARAFARKEFDWHEYVFAAHPHVHVVVLARGRNGRRLNPRRRICNAGGSGSHRNCTIGKLPRHAKRAASRSVTKASAPCTRVSVEKCHTLHRVRMPGRHLMRISAC